MLLFNVASANWAQASGFFEQNVVIPKIPGVNTANAHWQARFGMSIIQSSDPSGGIGTVWLLGGDTYDGTSGRFNSGPGLMDQTWGNGYKNDVWSMTTAEWKMEGNIRLRTEYKQKIPDVKSELTWKLRSAGLLPPPGMTYNNFTICESYFGQQERYKALRQALCDPTRDGVPPSSQWSPRRHHGGVYFKNQLYIMGGRAREFVELPEIRSVGGIMGPRVKVCCKRHKIHFTRITCFSVVLFTSLLNCLFVCLFVCLSICFACVFVCLLSICLFVCLSVCLSGCCCHRWQLETASNDTTRGICLQK